jgi:hypothetical protein
MVREAVATNNDTKKKTAQFWGREFIQSISSSCDTGVAIVAARAASVGEPGRGAVDATVAAARPGQRAAMPLTPPGAPAPPSRPGDCGGRLITGLLGFEPRPPPPGAGERPRCGDCGVRDTVRRGDVAVAIESGGTGTDVEPSAGKLAAERVNGGGGADASSSLLASGAAGGGGGCSGGAGLSARGDATVFVGGGNGGLEPSGGGGGRGEAPPAGEDAELGVAAASGGRGSTGASDGGGGLCGEPGVMSSGGSGGGVPAVSWRYSTSSSSSGKRSRAMAAMWRGDERMMVAARRGDLATLGRALETRGESGAGTSGRGEASGDLRGETMRRCSPGEGKARVGERLSSEVSRGEWKRASSADLTEETSSESANSAPAPSEERSTLLALVEEARRRDAKGDD